MEPTDFRDKRPPRDRTCKNMRLPTHRNLRRLLRSRALSLFPKYQMSAWMLIVLVPIVTAVMLAILLALIERLLK